MKAKIDLEKFICSYVKWSNIQDALRDQGLKCWNGEIVEIPQESEDEMIRKALVRFHKSTIEIYGIKGKEILAWLEKQAPKPKWGEEDEGMMNHCIGAIHIAGCHVTNSYTANDKKAMKDWLKSLKQRLGGEQ